VAITFNLPPAATGGWAGAFVLCAALVATAGCPTCMTPIAPLEASAKEWVTKGYAPASGMVASNIAAPPGGTL